MVLQLISGSGGKIIYDEKPSLLYRQHEDNVIGSNKGILAKILRFKKVIKENLYIGMILILNYFKLIVDF